MFTLLGITLLTVAAIFALQYSSVQTYVSKKVARYLSRELHAEISIRNVYLNPFRSLELQGIAIDDRTGKKLITAKKVTATFSLAKLFENELEIRKLSLEDAQFNYEIYRDSTNISFLIDYFGKKEEKKEKSSRPLQLKLQQLKLSNNRFTLKDHRFKGHAKGVDFANLDLQDISGELDHINYSTNEVQADIRNLTFREKSGLHLRELSAQSVVSNSKMEFSNMVLRTNRSKVGDYLLFHYNEFADFTDFIHKVNMEGTLNNAFVDSRDIEFFAPEMSTVHFVSAIGQASVSGTVAHMRVRDAMIRTGQQTALHGNFTIDGLPNIEQTKFDFDLTSLRTSAADVERLIPELSALQQFRLPKQLHQLGNVQYRGKLSGLYHSFQIDGLAQTDLGALETKTRISLRPTIQFVGSVHSASFALGKVLASSNFDRTGFNLKFDGKGSRPESLQLSVEGSVNNFGFKNYPYQQIVFKSNIAEQRLSARGNIIDPNANLSFDGDIDWSQDAPSYEVSSFIDYLNLKRLNLFTKDSIVVRQSNLRTELRGTSLNTLNGHLSSDHLQFQSSRGDFMMNYLDFESSGDEQSKLLTLKSDVVDGVVHGQIDLNSIGAYFRSLAMRYAPAINIEATPYNPQNFELQVNIKSFDPVSALFDPNLRLDDGATLNAEFSSDNYTANFDAFSPVVSYKGMKVSNLALSERADDRAFSLSVNADRFNFSDSAYIEHIHIRNVLANDSLNFQIALSEKSRANYLNLNGNIHFAHNKPAYIRFDRSDIVLDREEWQINEDADLRVSKGKFYLKNLLLRRDKQQVSFNGILSNENDSLDVAFKEFSLASLSGITKPLGIQLQGSLSGDLRIHSVLQRPNLSAHIRTSPIIFNSLPIGNLTVNADFDPQSGLINSSAKLLDVDGKGIDLAGSYDVNSTQDALRLQGKIKDLDAGILQPFLKNLVTDLYGKLSGEVTIGGTVRRPLISGMAHIPDASFLVNYLNTKYTVANQHAVVQNNRIYLNNFRFADSKNSAATAQGYVDLNTLTDPTLDIEASAQNFQILQTGRKDNEVFFGTAYATGIFRFKGPTSGINIDINARANPNTVITIPFNSSLKVSDNDFFYFISPDSLATKEAASKSLFKGLTMNMDLSLTRDAEINLENNIGSLKGVGTGNISLRISSLGDFEMFGDYHVLAGKFHFTAQDFFNKFFDLKEGGTIRWAGDPAEASVNLSATYQQRTSVAPLYNAAGRTENNDRILAQADMILKGTLSQPEISFDLNFPQDPYIKDELQGYLSDGNNINQQAISLIVRRSFTPASTQEFGREVNNTLLSAGTEIAFNQLNSIISQSLNMNFLDLNIRSFNDASASLRFFDDRLIFTGGVSDRSRNQLNDLTLFSDQIATDAEVTFRLRQDGNLVLRAYNRLNTRNFLFTPYSDYISAVGLVYRQEFNSLPEFWRKLWLWNDRKQRIKESSATDSVAFD